MRRPLGVVTDSGRFVRESLFQQFAIKSAGTDARGLPPDRFQGTYGSDGIVTPLYAPEKLLSLLDICTWHNRCVDVKARDTAGLGWFLDGDEGANEPARETLDAFFSDQELPIRESLYRFQMDEDAIGYGALEMVRENHAHDGRPVKLIHRPGHTFRVHASQRRYLQRRGNKKRWFKAAGLAADLDYETGVEHAAGSLPPERRASEIIWGVNYTPRSDYYGSPDVIPALQALDGEFGRHEYNRTFFESHGVPTWAVYITGNFDPGEEDAETGLTEVEQIIQDNLDKIRENPHSTMTLLLPSVGEGNDIEIEFKRLDAEVKEASFRLYGRDNRDEIIVAHGVPPYRVGLAETGSLGGSTAEESSRIYAQSVIEPRQDRLEMLIERHVIRDGFGFEGWRFKLEEMRVGDEDRDLNRAEQLFKLGAVTPNQLIRKFASEWGFEPSDHPAMDMYYLNGQPITAEDQVFDQSLKMLGALKALASQADANADETN